MSTTAPIAPAAPITPAALYTCAACGKAVIVLNGEIIRACLHTDAAVHANASAVVKGVASFASGPRAPTA